jgi:dynein heavy chain
MQSLCTPGMRGRHWEQLKGELGLDIQLGDSFTLQAALQQGLLAHLATIGRVADVAAKEFAIEQALDKMQQAWEGAELGVLAYRDTGTFIVKVCVGGAKGGGG